MGMGCRLGCFRKQASASPTEPLGFQLPQRLAGLDERFDLRQGVTGPLQRLLVRALVFVDPDPLAPRSVPCLLLAASGRPTSCKPASRIGTALVQSFTKAW
jgi:hypothetical protein